MSSAVEQAGFFERVYNVVTTPPDVVEGSIWGVWLGYQVKQLISAVDSRRKAEALPDTDPEKTEKVWNAQKGVFLKTAMTVSAGAYLGNWAGEVGIIQFGRLQPLVSGLGYFAAATTSPFAIWDAVKELNQSSLEYDKAEFPHEKQALGLKLFDHMLNIAMLVCFTAWGVLGIVYSAIGGSSLFYVVDSCFLFGGILFLARLGYAVFFLPAKASSEETSSSP